MSQDTDALRRAAKGFLGHSTQSRPPFTDEEADAWLARGSADALALKAAIAAALSTAPAPERRSRAAEDVLAERERQINAENWTPEHDDAHADGAMAQAAVTYIAHNYRKPYREPEPVKYQAVAEAALAAHESMGTFRAALKQRAEKRRQEDPESARPSWWPWSIAWWKPTTPRRDLVKAGALILAEIERLDRAAIRTTTAPAEGGEA